MPSDERLRNPGGPAFKLRAFNNFGKYTMPKEGTRYNMREFDNSTTSVSHLYFHPDTRRPPIPPFAELQAFIANNPDTPVIVDRDRKDSNPCEMPHLLFATLVCSQGKLTLGAGNIPTIHLFTVAADNAGRAYLI